MMTSHHPVRRAPQTPTRFPSRVVAVGAVLGVAATLAACSSASQATTDAKSGTAALVVDAPPNTSSAGAAYAASSGLFTKAGITVRMNRHQGAQSTIVGLLAGSYPIVWATISDILAGQAKGLPIKIVALGDAGSPGQIGVLTLPGSPVTKPADLIGKTVAIPSPTSACAIAIPELLKSEGVDPAGIKYVPVPQVQHEATLQNKVADAVCTPEPFQTQIKQALKARVVLDVFSGATKGMLVGGFVTTQAYAQKNPAVIKDFRTGLTQADQQVNAQPSLLRALLPTYTGIDASLAKVVALPTYEPDVTSVANLRAFADQMRSVGMLSKPADVAAAFAASS